MDELVAAYTNGPWRRAFWIAGVIVSAGEIADTVLADIPPEVVVLLVSEYAAGVIMEKLLVLADGDDAAALSTPERSASIRNVEKMILPDPGPDTPIVLDIAITLARFLLNIMGLSMPGLVVSNG